MRQTKFIFTLLFILSCMFSAAAANTNSTNSFPPFHIADNLYYVGDEHTASYLVVTPKGNILINSNDKESLPKLKASIAKLGFKFKDIKMLLISHAHADHDAANAVIKKETGARYMVMDADVPAVTSGGKTDFQYAHDITQLYQPTKVDRVLHDGDQVKLGDTVLVAHLTPGHTKGCTTWTMKVSENGKKYDVVIVGSPYVNPGYQLVHNVEYPKIAEDYQRTFKVLASLPCDIFLGAHGMYFGLKQKYALMKKGKKNPFVDREGYKKFITLREKDFRAEWLKQKSIFSD